MVPFDVTASAGGSTGDSNHEATAPSSPTTMCLVSRAIGLAKEMKRGLEMERRRSHDIVARGRIR